MARDLLIEKADKLAHEVYKVTKGFPKDELYGITSQLRRAALSIVLNLIEGYARNKKGEYVHFLEIAYGSLKETKYLLYFCFKEEFLSASQYKVLLEQSEEIGRMVWERMNRLKKLNKAR